MICWVGVIFSVVLSVLIVFGWNRSHSRFNALSTKYGSPSIRGLAMGLVTIWEEKASAK